MSSLRPALGEAPPRAILVMGVAGSGKSTVGRALAEALGWVFHDGDGLHSLGNIAKMSSGIPLTDEDRAPWLAVLRFLINENLRRGESIVIACSALKETYRDQLLEGNDIALVYLRADHELIRTRLRDRSGHYMRLEMLESQFDVLEEPDEAIIVDAAQEPETIVDTIIAQMSVVSQRQAEGQ